ncbi:hypothetical protein SDC9_184950 [bioreactor metagenome]|uniref:Uncharacterized protein n=1 Tax=bioreactor metagenome TaxID=1076179 RepID=A0A645HGB8_9ZZZZ
MLGIHVRLDLENESREIALRGDNGAACRSRVRRRRQLEKRIQQELDAKVVYSAAEKHRCEFAGQDCRVIKLRAGPLKHVELFHRPSIGIGLHLLADGVVAQAEHRYRSAIFASRHALKKVYQVAFAIIDAAKVGSIAQGPVHRIRRNAQHSLQFVQKR